MDSDICCLQAFCDLSPSWNVYYLEGAALSFPKQETQRAYYCGSHVGEGVTRIIEILKPRSVLITPITRDLAHQV